MSDNFTIYLLSAFFISNTSMASDLTRDEVKTALKHPANKSLLDAMPDLDLDVESKFPIIAAMLDPESLVKQSGPKPQVSVSSASSSSTQPARSMLSVRDPAESDVVAPVYPRFKSRIREVETAKDKKNFKDSDTTDELMVKLLKRRLESEEK